MPSGIVQRSRERKETPHSFGETFSDNLPLLVRKIYSTLDYDSGLWTVSTFQNGYPSSLWLWLSIKSYLSRRGWWGLTFICLKMQWIGRWSLITQWKSAEPRVECERGKSGMLFSPVLMCWSLHSWTIMLQPRSITVLQYCVIGLHVAQRSKALHLSARGVTTVPGSKPGCITSVCDWQSHKAVYNWPSIGQL